MGNFLTSNNVQQGTTPWIMSLSYVGGVAFALGQHAMAGSISVTIASDQSAIPNNLTQVGGSGVSLGAKTSANSIPVVLASDETVPVSFSEPITATPAGYNGTILTTAVSVATTATALPTTPLANRKTAQIQNLSNQTLYLGGSGVTTANGLQIPAGETESIDLGTVVLYGIVATSTANVIVMEIS